LQDAKCESLGFSDKADAWPVLWQHLSQLFGNSVPDELTRIGFEQSGLSIFDNAVAVREISQAR